MGWSIQYHPEVHVCMAAKASVETAEMESPNEGLTTVFPSLRLVERQIFMAESARFGFKAVFCS